MIQPFPPEPWAAIVAAFRQYLQDIRDTMPRAGKVLQSTTSTRKGRKTVAALSSSAYQARHIHLLPAGTTRPALVDNWTFRQRQGLWALSGTDAKEAA
jgi:hypothetical protein